MTRMIIRSCGALLLVGSLASGALATPITFSASRANLAASAAFDTVGGKLQVTLTNTSAADVLVPADVLTALFFTISGVPELTPVSALLGGGSSVLFDGQPAGGNVGGEWGYADVDGPNSAKAGISSAGFGLFGEANFGGANLQGPTGVGGLQYGITSAGDDPSKGNSPVTGGTPNRGKSRKDASSADDANALIKNSVVFTLSGVPEGFDPSTSITSVSFQYGTSLTEPNLPSERPVPEPSTLVLLGSGLLGLLGALRRFDR